MPQPIPYLAFDGSCAEAMAFYAEALGGTLERVLRAADSPMAEHFKEHPEAVVHARLRLPGDSLLMAGDVGPMPYEGIKGVSITLNYDTVAAAERAFDALAARATVVMPLQATFWARTWGMLTDHYGTPWIINGELLPD
ncbi:MAG: VOC family protein [Gammaproteobacteria bacterium]